MGWAISTAVVYFSQLGRLRSPRSRCQQIWYLLRSLFLVWRWPPFCCILPWQRRRSHVSFSFYKGINHIYSVPPSWPNPTLLISWRPHIQIPSHSGLGLQHINLELGPRAQILSPEHLVSPLLYLYKVVNLQLFAKVSGSPGGLAAA